MVDHTHELMLLIYMDKMSFQFLHSFTPNTLCGNYDSFGNPQSLSNIKYKNMIISMYQLFS